MSPLPPLSLPPLAARRAETLLDRLIIVLALFGALLLPTSAEHCIVGYLSSRCRVLRASASTHVRRN